MSHKTAPIVLTDVAFPLYFNKNTIFTAIVRKDSHAEFSLKPADEPLLIILTPFMVSFLESQTIVIYRFVTKLTQLS